VRPALALLLAACLLGGCSPFAGPTAPSGPSSTATPTSTSTSTSTAAAVARAQRTHEYSSGPPPAQHGAPQQSPTAAIRTFAAAYINWNAGTVAADMRLLAAASVDQARSAMQLAAAHVAQDYELARGGIANAGTVEAIAPLAGGKDQYVVVTRERTTATSDTAYAGLGAAWHLTVATVSRVAPRLWVLSGWQPES
jgi:hypothetical protein